MTKSAPKGAPSFRTGDVVELTFDDLLANGQGVGRSGGLVVFVSGPLPGERARVRVVQVKANYAVGEVVDWLEQSPERVTPFCEVFGRCGGCQVQHLAYDAQLRWKEAIVRSALERIGHLAAPPVAPAIGMNVPRGYRNKMALVVRATRSGPVFGFYAARTHDVVPIHTCPVVRPELDGWIAGLEKAATERTTAAVFNGARHVVARVGTATGRGAVAVTTERRSVELAQRGTALMRVLPGVAGVVNSFEPTSVNAILGRKQSTVAGDGEIEESIGDIHFRVSAASFFQINSAMVERIFAFTKPLVKVGMRLADFYCGAGTFALFFASCGATVLGIEENGAAVNEARANAARNHCEQATTFITGKVEQAIRAQAVATFLKTADAVFLDPPRRGTDGATLGAIVEARVPAVWYLSCDPATLARDIAILVNGGYRLSNVQPFDMFPQTGHVEALATLEFAGENAAAT